MKRRWVGRILVVAGLVLVGSAMAHPAKAWIGHNLLERTFNDRLSATAAKQADDSVWRPWPGADLAPIGELNFPELGERRVVVDSASGEALAWSVGHVVGTAELGAPGVSAIAGHRDGRFALLSEVSEGDSFELTTLSGETVRYVVYHREVVDSEVVALPRVHSGDEELILTTCWPLDAFVSGSERLLLRARPV